MAIIPDTGANYLDQIYDNAWLVTKGIELLTRAQLDECLTTKLILEAPALRSGNGIWLVDNEELLPVSE